MNHRITDILASSWMIFAVFFPLGSVFRHGKLTLVTNSQFDWIIWIVLALAMPYLAL